MTSCATINTEDQRGTWYQGSQKTSCVVFFALLLENFSYLHSTCGTADLHHYQNVLRQAGVFNIRFDFFKELSWYCSCAFVAKSIGEPMLKHATVRNFCELFDQIR